MRPWDSAVSKLVEVALACRRVNKETNSVTHRAAGI